MPLSRARILGLSPNREPIFVIELPSATMKSNSPPAIRCAIGAGVARGSATRVAAGAGGGIVDKEAVGEAVGLDSEKGHAQASVTASAIESEEATIR